MTFYDRELRIRWLPFLPPKSVNIGPVRRGTDSTPAVGDTLVERQKNSPPALSTQEGSFVISRIYIEKSMVEFLVYEFPCNQPNKRENLILVVKRGKWHAHPP